MVGDRWCADNDVVQVQEGKPSAAGRHVFFSLGDIVTFSPTVTPHHPRGLTAAHDSRIPLVDLDSFVDPFAMD